MEMEVDEVQDTDIEDKIDEADTNITSKKPRFVKTTVWPSSKYTSYSQTCNANDIDACWIQRTS